MPSECFWGHAGDVLIAEFQYKDYMQLTKFRKAYQAEYDRWKESQRDDEK
jgi:hypothetical protein